MNRYGELFLQEMAQKYDDLDIALETPTGKGLKILYDHQAHIGSKHLLAGHVCYRKKQYDQAARQYTLAKKTYTKLRNRAMREIDDEDTSSWVIRLFLQPCWITVFQLIDAKFDLKSTVRKSTVKQIDDSMSGLDDLIKKCNEKQREVESQSR